MFDAQSTAKQTIPGAAAGFLATLPMTATMATVRSILPPEEQHPIPPRRVVGSLTKKTGLDDDMDEGDKDVAIAASHFAYGAAAGALYSLLFGRRQTRLLYGAGFGVAVWAGSYLGWLPALNILPSAHRDPKGWVAMNIIAHGVWGLSTAALAKQFAGPEEE